MKHYDNQINRDQCMGWFETYCEEFVKKTFGAEKVRYYSFGTMAWEYSTFRFDLTDGCQFEGRLTYAECNNGRGMLEIFQRIWSWERGQYELVGFEYKA